MDSLNLNAGTGDIQLTAAGDVFDSDTQIDVQANTFTVVLTASDFGKAGDGNAIDTSVVNLNVDTEANNGSQFIAETDNLASIELKAGAGLIEIQVGGVIIDNDAALDVMAATFDVVAQLGVGQSASTGLDLDIDNLVGLSDAGPFFASNTGSLERSIREDTRRTERSVAIPGAVARGSAPPRSRRVRE